MGGGTHPVVVATNRCCCNRNPASSTLVLSSGSAASSSVRRTYIVLITLHMTLFFSILPCAHFLIDGRYLAIVALDNLAFTGTVHTILVGTRTGMSGLHRSGCSSTTQRTSLFKSSWLWVLPASTRSSQHVHLLIFTVKGYSFNFRTASNQQNTKRVCHVLSFSPRWLMVCYFWRRLAWCVASSWLVMPVVLLRSLSTSLTFPKQNGICNVSIVCCARQCAHYAFARIRSKAFLAGGGRVLVHRQSSHYSCTTDELQYGVFNIIHGFIL